MSIIVSLLIGFDICILIPPSFVTLHVKLLMFPYFDVKRIAARPQPNLVSFLNSTCMFLSSYKRPEFLVNSYFNSFKPKLGSIKLSGVNSIF